MNEERYIQTSRGLLTLQDFLIQYFSEPVPDWDLFLKYVNEAFNINNEEKYKEFLLKMNLKWFDYERMKEFYKEIKKVDYPFEDDILKYIAYLKGGNYFERIGNPSLEVWLNARYFNKPFDDSYINKNQGFSLLEVVGLVNGGNAIRNQLLSALKF